MNFFKKVIDKGNQTW